MLALLWDRQRCYFAPPVKGEPKRASPLLPSTCHQLSRMHPEPFLGFPQLPICVCSLDLQALGVGKRCRKACSYESVPPVLCRSLPRSRRVSRTSNPCRRWDIQKKERLESQGRILKALFRRWLFPRLIHLISIDSGKARISGQAPWIPR